MVGIAAVIVKVMLKSLNVDLSRIKKEGEKNLKKEGALNISIEEKTVAFGLKALYFKFAWPEDKETSLIENSLQKIKEVSSVSIEDYRRAFG